MTRLAVLSDIHGNLPALKAVIAEIEQEGLDAVVVSGDVVNWGPFSREVLERITTLGWACIRGNNEYYLLDYGTVYNPPQALRDFVIARDAVSRFPMSSTRAHRSHLDHAIPFSHGGPTPVRTSAPSPATRTARNTKPAGSSNCTTTA